MVGKEGGGREEGKWSGGAAAFSEEMGVGGHLASTSGEKLTQKQE